ncbi:aldolase/citrate lyase family protein [Ensifer sp. YR511]|uniref:aldolase/citrate lyase family protein n=1 Tax=Ensifer sp. YR511 TaxID=1855294 RepID=UPI000887AC3E|nr:aldolase/citrate lyase family protein [Ensifer sp. YR511]SDN73549.1 2-keto-3-deoxy-L-rhamnonate aldolase RhmA [Ensifer sp. YR511]
MMGIQDMNKVRRLWAEDRVAIGAHVKIPTPALVLAAAEAGCAFVRFDLYHWPYNQQTLEALTNAARSASISPWVRCRNDANEITRSLQMGVEGFMIPCVGSAEEARHAAKALSACAGSERPILACAIENSSGLNNFDEIIAVKEVDIISTGPSDLAFALGISDRWDPRVRRLYDEVLAKGLAAGKQIYMTGQSNPESVQRLKGWVERGLRVINIEEEYHIETRSYRPLIEELRRGSATDTSTGESGRHVMKNRLGNEQTVVGMALSFTPPATVDVASLMAPDFVLFENAFDETGQETLENLIRAAVSHNIVPWAKCENDPYQIMRTLDLGATALTVLNVNSKEAALQCIRSAWFPPCGDREANRPYRTQHIPAAAYGEWSRQHTFIACEISDQKGLLNALQIADTDGVDAIVVDVRRLKAGMNVLRDLADYLQPLGKHLMVEGWPEPGLLRMQAELGAKLIVLGPERDKIAATFSQMVSELSGIRIALPLGL